MPGLLELLGAMVEQPPMSMRIAYIMHREFVLLSNAIDNTYGPMATVSDLGLISRHVNLLRM
jgi:hypothetical protein